MRIGFSVQDGTEHEADLSGWQESVWPRSVIQWFQTASMSACISTTEGHVVSGRYVVRAWEIDEDAS